MISVVFSVMESKLSSAVSSVNATVMDMLKFKNRQVASGQEVFIIYSNFSFARKLSSSLNPSIIVLIYIHGNLAPWFLLKMRKHNLYRLHNLFRQWHVSNALIFEII